MNDLKQIIAKNIADLRISEKMTQLDLAEKLNYSDKAISKWERGESIPDIAVLKEIADLFEVSLDYLVEAEHPVKPVNSAKKKTRFQNHAFITGISIILVWLISTLIFVVIDLAHVTNKHWLSFIFAIPASMIVWLVFNSIWFNHRRNFLIVSLLMWSVLLAFFIAFVTFGFSVWQVLFLGIPGQVIILLWSRIRRSPQKSETEPPKAE